MGGKTKLSTKLIGGFVVVAFIAAIIGYIGYSGVNTLDQHIEEIGDVRMPSVVNMHEIRYQLQKIVTAQRTLLQPNLSADLRQVQYENFRVARELEQAAVKAYELIPQTKEEAQEWQVFKGIVADWTRANDEAMQYSHEFDAIGIPNPPELRNDMWVIRTAHYDLELRIADMFLGGEVITGGDDYENCALGRWLVGFSTSNRELQRLISDLREPHRRFHESVRSIRNTLNAGNKTEALRLYREVLQPNAQQVFAFLDKVIAESNRADALSVKLRDVSMGRVRDYQRRAFACLENVAGINDDLTEKSVKQADDDGSRAVYMVFITLIIGSIIALAFGIVLSNAVSSSLNRIISSLTSGAEQLNSAATQVSSASQGLAEGATEQASSLEEISASLEEMTAMTQQNADNSNSADGMAREANNLAEGGVKSMSRMADALEQIKKSSGETAKIIKTIDEIAFQTNLLALNAAVEAARAGDAGKGFAVVAEEVRNLAQRSAEAAKNTSEMIENAQRNVENGVNLGVEVNEALGNIRDVSSKVATLVGEISVASNEQAQGIDQVSRAVAEMDKVVQNNAAGSEESASAAEELSSQAEDLKDIVRDLAIIVGGSAAGVELSSYSALRPGSARRFNNPQVVTKPIISRSSAKPASVSKTGASAIKPRKQNTSPQDVLPLTDSDLDDF